MSVLVLDIGTSCLKAVIYDAQGNPLRCASFSYAVGRHGDACVMDMGQMDEALKESLAQIGGSDVSAVAVTSQRSSVIAVDAAGTPLAPALTWQDRRAQAICDAIDGALVCRVTGARPSPVYSGPKIRYLRGAHPGLYDRAHKLIGFYEYALKRLTGRFSTDATVACRSGLMDIRTGQWDEGLLALYQVDRQKLCPIHALGFRAGLTNAEAVKQARLKGAVPVIGAGGDQQCAAVGLGCVSTGDVSINCGTGAYVIGMTDEPRMGMEWVVSNAAIPGKWLYEKNFVDCGGRVDAFCRKQYGALRYEALEDETRKGSFTEAYRMLTGLASEVAECFAEIVALMGAKPQEVSLAGGVARNEAFCRLLAQALRVRVRVPKQKDATTYGAFLVAQAALGRNETVARAYQELMRESEQRCFEPFPEGGGV